jgi:hypothetical protein
VDRIIFIVYREIKEVMMIENYPPQGGRGGNGGFSLQMDATETTKGGLAKGGLAKGGLAKGGLAKGGLAKGGFLS